MRLLLVPLVLLLAGCAAPAAEDDPGAGGPSAPTTRLLVLGDTGTGEPEQHRVANAARALCAQRGCDAAVLLGDNIYETGVGSVDDPQFQSKFEEPYAAFDIPFYLVLGNHDNGANGLGAEPHRGDFQVAYTDRSERWNMPGRYYDVRIGDVHLFGLDSTALWFGGYATHDAGGRQQRAWLASALEDSNATWKVVMAHHPYISNGQHNNAGSDGGPEPITGDGLKKFYEEVPCGKARLFLGGHDHDLQWLKETAACPGVEHVISGAAAKQRPLDDPNRNPAWYQKGDTLGFAWISFTPTTYTVAFYDAAGALLHEGTRPRDAGRL